MELAKIINLLVTLTLIVMMISVGLSVTFGEIADTARNGSLVAKTMIANYIAFPATALALLVLFHVRPMPALGFLILAVCPGAPFGPPVTGLAKANVAVSVGIMILLAGSSVVLAPLLLSVLLPWLSTGASMHVDAGKIVVTLLLSQLLPLAVGLVVRHVEPKLGSRLEKPFNIATKALGAIAIVLIVVTRFQTLAQIKLAGLVGMLTLWALSMVYGWLAGESREGVRMAVAETTALRNVGLAMVIAARSFPDAGVLPAVVAYGAISILACVIVAFFWGRSTRPGRIGGGVAMPASR